MTNAATGSADAGRGGGVALAFVPGSSAWIGALCVSRGLATTWSVAYAAVLPLVQADWGLTNREAGSVQSAWQLGFLISMFLVGFASDRFGARRTFVATGIAVAASPFLFVLFAHGFWSGYLLYGLTGLCTGGTYSPVLALIKEHTEQARRGRAMGFLLASSSASFALCFAIAGLLLKFVDWRTTLGVIAVLSVFSWLVALATMRNTPNVVHPRPAGESQGAALQAVVRDRRSMLSILGYTFHNWELLGMWAWLPTFLAAALAGHGIGATEALSTSVGLTALTYVANIGGNIVGGTMADRFGRTSTILVWSSLSVVLSLSIGWLITLPIIALVALACLYNFAAIADSSTHSTVLAESVPPHLIGVALSVRSVLGFGAAAVSPIVFGFALDLAGAGSPSGSTYAWGIAWMTLGIGALFGPIATWKLHRMGDTSKQTT
jgi:MFS family permease